MAVTGSDLNPSAQLPKELMSSQFELRDCPEGALEYPIGDELRLYQSISQNNHVDREVSTELPKAGDRSSIVGLCPRSPQGPRRCAGFSRLQARTRILTNVAYVQP